MTALREAAEKALEALLAHADIGINADKAIAALRSSLEQSVPPSRLFGSTVDRAVLDEHGLQGTQDPVGYFSVNDYGTWQENRDNYGTPLYTAPSSRDWVRGLTISEISAAFGNSDHGFITESQLRIYAAIESKLKEKNA